MARFIEKCPHDNQALTLYVCCESQEDKMVKQLLKRHEEETNVFIEKTIDPSETCEMSIRLEGNSEWNNYEISHYQLCKHNGFKRMEPISTGFKKVNCKTVQTIEIHAKTEFDIVKDRLNLQKCKHEEECNPAYEEPKPILKTYHEDAKEGCNPKQNDFRLPVLANNITINNAITTNFNNSNIVQIGQNFDPILSKWITDQQGKFLEEQQHKQGLTNLAHLPGSAKSIIKIDLIM